MHCTTEKMVADKSSKPNQGELFDFQRNFILGLKGRLVWHEKWHEEVLKKYDLWDDLEFDLDDS